MSKDKLPKAQSGNTVDNPNLLSEQGLQESFGGYANNVDIGPLPGKSSDPYVSSVKANKLQSETSPDEYFKNAYDNFLKDTQKEDDMRLSNPRTLDEYSENEGGRFEYYMPGGYDNEDSYAQGQSFGERMVNGIGKGLLLTGTTLLQSTVGLVNGAFAAINDGKFSSFYNNDFNNYLDSITKASEDYLPNFYTKEERNAKWYSPQYWATGNFLWDGVVKNLGFAAGAALSGGVFTGVLKALPLTSRLFAVGRGAQAATATAEGVVAGTTNRVASTLGKIRSLSDDFLGGYNAMNPGGRALVAGLATSGEAGIEALHNSNEYRQELINEHIAEYGIEPTGESLDRINAATEGAGNSTFFANMALLSATNYIQFPKILGSTYSGERAIINGLTREIERDLVYEGGRLARAAVKYPFLSRLNKIRPYTFSISEAFEEVAQYSATVATKDYYNKGLNGEATSFMESMSVGVTKGAFSNEGAKNALIGGISGSIMLGRGRFKQNKRLQEDTDAAIDLINNDETSLASVVKQPYSKNIASVPPKESLSDKIKNTLGDTKENKENKNYTEYENIEPSNFSKETKESLNRSAQLQEERTDSIENGEVMNSKDLEADEIINYLTPRVKYGRFDLVMADLADYKALASTEAGFAQLVAEGKALETDTREAYQERLARFEETAQNFNSLWKSINLRYSSEYVTDDNGDPVEVGGKKIRKYSASVMNKMLYAATKVSDFDSRISSTSSKLTSAGINTSAVIDSIVNGDFEAYNEAVDAIKNLDEISETKDELGLALDDMAEMVGKRQEFIKTYEEIKSKPNKFTEEAMLSAVESAAQVITIQTKNGPIDVKLGIPYFAGNSPEYTSKNINDFLNGSTIGQMIVQGQDENGNLLVFIPDEGVVKTFTPAAFEKLNASPASTIRRDKKAKYYYNFKDKVFYFNKGKNEGGKVPGRLEYKDGNLYFVSLGKNNRLERKIITRNHFVAQGTSTEALVTLSETEVLTDVQKAVSTAFLSTRDLKNEKADLEEARQDNIRVIGELVEDTKKTLDVVDGKLQKASEKLAKVKEDLENIAKMVKTGEKISLNFSKATIAFTRALNMLTQMEKDITNSIQELEAEKESLQYNISYFESFIDQIYNTSEDFGDFAQKLKNDVARLKGMQKSTSKKIQYSKDILSSIADTIKEVGRLIREAIKSTVSVTGDNYQYLNSLLDEVASGKNVLENWPKLKEEIVNLKLTANLVKDSKVDSKKLETTLNKLEELSSKLVELQKEYNASKEILRVFEPQIKQYELQKEQQERLRNNQTILDNLKSTEDTSTPLDDDGGVTKPDFEAEPKKSNELLIVAGVPADARHNEGAKNLLPHEKRSDEFGRNFSSMDSDQRDGLRIIYVTPETEALLGLGGLFDYMLQVPNNIVGEENIEKKKKQLAKYKATGIIQVIVNEKNEIVDQEGNVIDSSLSDNEKVNQAIYQFMPEANMLEERMRTENGKSQSPTIIESLVNAYKNWKDGILGVSKLGDSYAMDVSFGQLKESPKNSTPIEDANLDLDLEQKNVIFIPKFDQDTTKGSVSYRSVPGRVYLDLANAYVPLRNRKHTEEEANAIFDSLLELSKDPELKLRKSKDIINFLKSVVYWGQPKELSTNSVYYAQDEQGNLVLGLSNDKTTYPYTYGSLQDSKEAIINKLTGMYNNVTSDYLKNVRAPYFQILSISEQGEVESVRWENYQTYLLSNKNANGKGSRTNPPLTTTLDKSDKNNPNRENIYFFRTEDTIKYEEEQEEGAPTNLPIVDNAPAEVAVVTDNKTVNKFNLSGNVISYTTGEITRAANAVTLIVDEVIESIIKKNSQYPREEIITQLRNTIYVKLVEDSEAQAAPTPTATPTKDDVEYRPKPKATPTTQETSDIKTKKAEIEKRREKELDKLFAGNYGWSGWKNSKQLLNSGNALVLSRQLPSSNKQAKYLIEQYKEINAKYDAELAALESTQQTSEGEANSDLSYQKVNNINIRFSNIKNLKVIGKVGGKVVLEGKFDENGNILVSDKRQNADRVEEAIKFILSGESLTTQSKDLVKTIKSELALNLEFELGAEPTQTSEVEDKKADIEKRRQEELLSEILPPAGMMKYHFTIVENKKVIISKDFKNVDVTPISGDNVETGPGTGVVKSNPNTITTKFENKTEAINFAISNLDKKRIDKSKKINAKYDAELAALEPTNKPKPRPKGRRSGRGRNRENRVALNNRVKQNENWKTFEAFLKKNLPNVPIIRVKNIIENGAGQQAWGMFQNGAIYIYENAEIGTGYHEVFESIWAMFTDAQEKEKTLETFRNRKGTFVDRPTGTTVKYSEATEEQAKEEVAEEFRRFMLKEKPATGFIGGMFKKLKKFIEDAILFIKTKLGLREEKKQDFIDTLFKNIDSGYYANRTSTSPLATYAQQGIVDILEVKDTKGAEFRLAINERARIDIISEMMYATQLKIKNSENGLFTQPNFSASFLDDLKADVYSTMDNYLNDFVEDTNYTIEQFEKNLATAEDVEEDKAIQQREIEKINRLKDDIENNWDEFIELYKQKMLALNVKFNEDNEAALVDIDKTKDSTFQDSTKRDHYKEASEAIRLLMSTVALKDKAWYNETKEIVEKQSSIGGAILLPSTQVYITLMNNLSDSTSVEDMLDKLRKLAIADINYRPVYTKLAGATVYSSKPTLNFKSAFEERLVTSLYNTFKKSANAAKSVYILEDGSTTVGSTALSNVALQMKSKYLGAIITNAKSQKGFFTYDEENNTYSSNSRFNKYGLKTNFDKNAQRFLNDLGIVISDEEINAISSSDAMYPEFKEAVLGLEKDLRNVRNVSFLSASVLQISNRLLEIATLQTTVSNPEYSSTFFVGGERRQSYLGVNVFSELYNFVSRFKNKSQLRDTQFSYLLTDVFSEGSTILKRLYTSKGNKVKASETLLQTGYLAELNNFEKGKQKSPSQMNFQERLVSEFNLNEKGWYFSLVPGDASTEWMMYMGNVITDSTDTQYLKEVFQGFFESEVKLSRADRKIVAAPGRKNTDLRFFKGILGEKLHNTIVDFVQAKKNENLTAEQVYNEFKNKIDNSVISYITELSKQNGLDLASYGIIEQDQANDGRLLKTFTMKNVQGGNKLSEEALNAKLFNNTANYMIANIEQHKLIFSDPYQYKDELKRVKNFLSPRQALALGDNSGKYTSVLDKIYNGDIASDDIAWTDFGRGNFRTVTLEDVMSMENLPNYTPHEETDGGGIISYKAYRWFRILASDWNADEEAQFQHDIGYEKLVKSDGVTQEKIDKYEKNNPAIKSAYTALKPIAAGAKSGFTYNNVVLDKYSLYPAAFRVMHKLNPKSNIVKLSDKMHAENIDYVIFDSGRKVGAETTFPPYKDGKFNEDLYTDVVEIPFSAISVQQDVPSKEGNTVPRGSQMTKLVTLDFLDNGVPEDFEMTEADLSIRFEKWFSLSEKEKVQASDLYKDIKENQAILEALITEGYNTLLEDLGIVDRGDRTYEVVDFEKASNALQSEIFKRDINNNIIEALSAFTNGTNSLEATPAYNQVRSILYSISDKRVLRQKMIGSQKVQISSVFFEGEERKLKVVKGKNGKKTNVYESNVLDFYSKGEVNKKTGKVGETNGMEIMIGRWFDSPLSDKDLLNYLNNTEEGKTLLKGVAFRIPTQAQSSIDSFKIKAFLPKEFGDSVVVPSGIVEKVGSDFDIDKLSIYFKNVYKDIKGILRVVPYYGIGEAAKSIFYKDVLAESNKRKKDYEGFAERYSNNFQEVVYGDGKNLTDAQTKLKNILEAAFSKDERTIQNVEDFFEKESAKIGKELEELNDEDYQNILVAQIANKRYIESLQNGYIESLQKLILNPLNYDRLIRPNSADYLKSLADDVITEVGEDAFVYNNADKMLQKGYMARLRHAFLTGKRAISIAAKNQTLKSLLQRTPVFMDERKRRGLPLEVQAFLPNLNVGFKNYNTINIPGKGEVITLSGTTENSDEEVKKLISDINGQAIDGFVDISNGPWIMQMGANPNVVATFQFLNTIGVPMKDVVYFMNQPIIRDYLKMIEVKGYSWLFIDDFVSDIKYSEKYSISETLNRKPLTEIPNAKELLKTISGKNLTLKQKEQQHFYLDEFLKYAQMSSQLFKLGQGVSWDTARLNDPFLVLKKSLALEQAEKTIFSSYDFGNNMVDDAASSIINSSFLKTLIPTLLDSRDALGSIITSDKRNSEFRKVLTEVLTPYANLSDREFVKLAKKAVANIFDYVVQNDRSVDGKPLNGEISRVLLDDVKGATAQVMKFINEVRSDVNHPLYDNQVINLLEADPSKKAGKVPNNLKLSSTDQNVYDQDVIIASFRQLRDEISVTPEGKRLYRKIIGIAVLQSGLTNSPISFTNLLPYEDFQEIYGKLDQLSSATNLQLFKDVSAFERNNWSDNSITPYAKAFWFKNAKGKWKYNAAMIYLPKNVQIAKQNGDIPQLVSMSTLGREGRSEHIVYSWDNEELSSDSKARMRANNDYSYINKGLFKKVYRGSSPLTYTYEDKHGDIKSFFIYKHINAWGDSFRANELHDHAKKSDIDNGFLKVVFKTEDQNGEEVKIDNEKPDTAIVAAFDNPGVKVKKFPSKAVKMPVEVTNATGTVEVVSEDYGVVNVETNPSEEFTKDLIDSISENIKENAYVENGSSEANLMFSYGDQWKGNRTKKPTGKVVKVDPAQIDFYNNGKMTVVKSNYFYDSKYNNGNNVPNISEINKLKTHIENTLGIDMTDYDVSLNNIYTKDTSLFRHTDIDESNTAKGYPVIVYVLGNEHKVRIDDAGGIRPYGNMLNPKTMTLKNGDVYTLGLEGEGRFEAVHDVIKGSNKSTKYPPITLPSGKVITNYTITFTFRRVRDLEPGMPTTPNKITQPGEQTIEDDLAIERAREIEELQAKKDTLDSNPEYIILSNIPKITPTSAKKETGGKVGVNQDINPSWLSRKGVSVEKAAEDIFANHFAESEEYSEAEIRDFIIDILSKSKLEANREIFDERRLAELLEYKQPTQKTSEVTINNKKWTKDSPKENANTGYVFTENINSIGDTRVGGGSAVIRNNPNAVGIVTKKYYTYKENRNANNKEQWNANFQDTDADFELFKKVNLEQFAKLDKFDSKIFPDSFANSLAAVPNRFALWLQNELQTRYGLITEVNSKGTGLISKSVQPTQQTSGVDTKGISLDNEVRGGWKSIKLNGKDIGEVKLVKNDRTSKEVGLSIKIKNEFQNKGYGQIAHTLAADWAKNEFGDTLYSDFDNSQAEINTLLALTKKGFAEQIGDYGVGKDDGYGVRYSTDIRAFRIKTSDELSNKQQTSEVGLGTETAPEGGNVIIPKDPKDAKKPQPGAVVAFRTKGKTQKNMIDALEDNAVGNPFGPYGSVKEETVVSVTRFLNWLEGTGDIKVMQNYRKAILDKASELKGKDIFYYKDLGRPSHATALDYFLNKPATQSEVTETQEEISDTPLVTETNQVSLFDSMSDVLKVTLRDNNRYDPNDINAAMLEGMGYTMAEAGKIIKKYNC